MWYVFSSIEGTEAMALVFKRDDTRPLWIKVVAPVTVLYLIFELAFNSHLLNVMSTTTSIGEITILEHWGRLLSGFAVALTCWPSIISLCGRFEVSVGRSVWIVLVWTVLVMGGVFHYEWVLNEHIVGNITPQERSQAALMSLLQDDVIQGRSTIPGYTALPGNPSAQKAVYALIPFFGLSLDERDIKTLTEARDTMLARRVREFLISPDALRRVNSLDSGMHQNWNRYWITMQLYDIESKKAYKGIDDLYTGLLQRIRLQGGRVPVPLSRSRDLVLIMKGADIIVPDGWRGDKPTYDAAAAKMVKSKLDAGWKEKAGDIPYGLTEETFRANPKVMSGLIQQAGLPKPMAKYPVTIKHYDGVNEDYIEHVVVPLGMAQTLETRLSYVGETTAYADGGRLGTFGRTQARAVVSPVLALVFSTLGAMIHLFKGLIYLIHLLTRIAFRNGFLKMIAVGLGVLFLTFAVAPLMAGRVCKQPFVAQALKGSAPFLIAWTGSPAMGQSLGTLLTSSVRLQTVLYPLGDRAPVSATTFSYDPVPWAD